MSFDAPPLVSVRVATYNHEPYIAQCLESILMQRTDLPFEVIVGEDSSTDGTRAVVVEYASRFPDRIRALLHEKNLGGQMNSYLIQQACKGKYHVMIEGDDFWIDPLKLQTQVDFMEAHPEVSLCFHNALILNERLAATRLYFETAFPEILNFDDICMQSLPTASVMARAAILATLPEWRLNIWCGDLLFRLWCLHHGPFAYLDRIMSVYRRHAGGLEVSRRKSGADSYFENVLFALSEFDRETGFQHTEAIQRETARMREDQSRHRQGLLYAILHPSHFAMRIREYLKVIRQKREFFN
jgi:glycosyltransferase involved in cell wall biosynthesis